MLLAQGLPGVWRTSQHAQASLLHLVSLLPRREIIGTYDALLERLLQRWFGHAVAGAELTSGLAPGAGLRRLAHCYGNFGPRVTKNDCWGFNVPLSRPCVLSCANGAGLRPTAKGVSAFIIPVRLPDLELPSTR